jgi:hypothetical protein
MRAVRSRTFATGISRPRSLATLCLLAVAPAAACTPADSRTSSGFELEMQSWVIGLPGERVSNGSAYLAPGDSLILHVARIGIQPSPCEPADTLRTGVTWASSDTSVATLTPRGDGTAILRARAPGVFDVLMSDDPAVPASPRLPPRLLPACPFGGIISSFIVTR